ncbi:MAG: hypothetical protein WEC34_12075, partial [Acidimicrobiia bacterium]
PPAGAQTSSPVSPVSPVPPVPPTAGTEAAPPDPAPEPEPEPEPVPEAAPLPVDVPARPELPAAELPSASPGEVPANEMPAVVPTDLPIRTGYAIDVARRATPPPAPRDARTQDPGAPGHPARAGRAPAGGRSEPEPRRRERDRDGRADRRSRADTSPAPTPAAAPPAPVAAAATRTIAAGEHLWSIAAEQVARASGRAPTELAPTDVAPYWTRLCMLNVGRLRSGNPSLVYTGEVLELPQG